MMAKYEFKMLQTTRDTKDDMLDELNSLGKDGWQLVHVEENRAGGHHAWLQRETDGKAKK